MTAILEKIKDALALVSGEDTSEITIDTDLENDLDLDSIVFVQFLLALEDVVPGLEFSQDLLADAKFTTIGSLVDFVVENGDDAAAA